MSNSRVAIRYAKAILERAHSEKVAEQVNNDMLLIASTLKNSKELRDFIYNPIIKLELKADLLEEIFSMINVETKGLFRLMLSNKRFDILEQVVKQYSLLFDKEKKIEIVEVITAFPITSDIESKVLDKLKTFSNNSIKIQNTIDPSIIGGFILKIGDQQYNNSIANRLRVLKREFSN